MNCRLKGIAVSIVLFHPNLNKLARTLFSLKSAINTAEKRQLFKSSHLFLVDNSVPPLGKGAIEPIISENYFNNDTLHTWSYSPIGKNTGYGAAHNYVINSHSFQYHVILNPDIYLEQDAIVECWECSTKDPDIVLITPHVRFADGQIQHLLRLEPTLFDVFLRFLGIFFPKIRNLKRYRLYECQHFDPLEPRRQVFPVTGCCMWCRTEALREVGGFDERFFLYYEDYDLSKRLAQKGTILYLPSFRVIHDWERPLYRSFYLMFLNMKSAMKYFNKWGWKLF